MPKMGNSAGYLRHRSQEEVNQQRKLDEELKAKAKALPQTLRARGCEMRVRKHRLQGGLSIIPEPREYYEKGKRYVGFPVR